MGWETLLILGTTAFKAVSGMQEASRQADLVNKRAAAQAQADIASRDAAVKEGNLAAKNKAQEVKLKADSQRFSFLNSGIGLEGTPMSVINGTFDTGIADVGQILENTRITAANYTKSAQNTLDFGAAEAKGIVSNARTQAITSMASAGFDAAQGAGMFEDIGSNLQKGMAETGIADTAFGRTFGGFSGDKTEIAGGETIYWLG